MGWRDIRGNLIGPILDDRLKETFLKPWKGVLCIHFRACMSVRPPVRFLTSYIQDFLTY